MLSNFKLIQQHYGQGNEAQLKQPAQEKPETEVSKKHNKRIEDGPIKAPKGEKIYIALDDMEFGKYSALQAK